MLQSGQLLCRAAFAALVMLVLIAPRAQSEPQLIYSEDWGDGPNGWSTSQSMNPGGRQPQWISVNHPLADHVLWFYGQGGWGLRGRPIARVPLKITMTAAIFGANRNALSMNVRNTGGGQIYKYGFCAGVIGANKQPPTFTYRSTDLGYRTGVPYELYSIWLPDTGVYALGLKNLVTGEDRLSRYLWRVRSNDTPAYFDIDQEGGRGPAALVKLDVHALSNDDLHRDLPDMID
ncbi:MAG: hypothetical protein NT045_04125 [Candidatus Aureabacteria bacterium]|nr:hypothetical protein [Candidatus Auribacterota bacterium]